MNFFEYQDRAHQNTQKLVGLFLLAIFSIIITIYVAALMTFGGLTAGVVWHPGLFIAVAVPTILVIGSGSCYKLMSLRQGGQIIAHDLGGRPIAPETTDPTERQLLNVVEEMAIAAGISVPVVYVLDHEPGINAFAAGFTPNDAVIGVTRGTLDQLNRDELQGVIGHEFSHILNGDMRLNLRLVGLLHGILLIYLLGRILVRFNSGSRSREKGEMFGVFGLALILIGGIGLVCGRLIKSAVSRQREFLADASSVQFTRNPSGIAEALQKISHHSSRSLIRSPYAETNSHLFFGSAIRFYFFEELFATHPPLEQRIRRLHSTSKLFNTPSSSTTQSSNLSDTQSSNGSRSPHSNHSLPIGFANNSAPSPANTVANTITANPDHIIAQVGTVTPEHFAYAQALLSQLPESIQAGLRDRQSAIAIIYALALDTEQAQIRDQQIAWLRQVEPTETVEATLQFNQILAQLDPRIRLPLLDLTIPVLRQSSTAQCQQLFKYMNGLAKVDGHWSLTEFVLYLVLFHRLQPYINPKLDWTVQYTRLDQVWSDCLMVLSALAQVGQTHQNTSNQDTINYAFRSGLYRLPGVGKLEIPNIPPSCNFSMLNKSLQRLSVASPKLKQAIVDACAHTVLLDNVVTLQEADLLRAIVIAFDCPLPPFLNPTTKGTRIPKAA